MGVKVGASEVGVYLGAEKLAGVGGTELHNILTSFNSVNFNSTLTFNIGSVTTQRKFYITTTAPNATEEMLIYTKFPDQEDYTPVLSVSVEELQEVGGVTLMGQFPKTDNTATTLSVKLEPKDTVNTIEGYSFIVFE